MSRVIKREIADTSLAAQRRGLRQCRLVLPGPQTFGTEIAASFVTSVSKALKCGGPPQRRLGGGNGFVAPDSQMRGILSPHERIEKRASG